MWLRGLLAIACEGQVLQCTHSMRRRPRSADWRREEERRVSLSRMRTYEAVQRLDPRGTPRSRRERLRPRHPSNSLPPSLLSSIALATETVRELGMTHPQYSKSRKLAPLRRKQRKKSVGRRAEQAAAERAQEQMREAALQRQARYEPSESVIKRLDEAPKGSLPTTVNDALKGTTTTMQSLLTIFDQLVQVPDSQNVDRLTSSSNVEESATSDDQDGSYSGTKAPEESVAGPRKFLENVFCNAYILENLLQEIVPNAGVPQAKRSSDTTGEVVRVIAALRAQIRRLASENAELRKKYSHFQLAATAGGLKNNTKDFQSIDTKVEANDQSQSSLVVQLEEELQLHKSLLEAAEEQRKGVATELAQTKDELKAALNVANSTAEREHTLQHRLQSLKAKAVAAEEHADTMAMEIERQRVNRMIGSCNHKSTQCEIEETTAAKSLVEPQEGDHSELYEDPLSPEESEAVHSKDGSESPEVMAKAKKKRKKKRKKKVSPPFKGQKWEESAIYWCKSIKNGRGLLHFAQNYRLSDIPEIMHHRLLSTIGEIVMDKVQADKIDDDAGNERDSMAEFCEEWHLHKYGLLSMAARECGKFFAAIRRNRREHPRFEIFGRLIGLFRPLQDEACNFILHAWSILEPCAEVMVDDKIKSSELWLSCAKCLQLCPRIFIRPDAARCTSDSKPYTFELSASQLTSMGRRIKKLEHEAKRKGEKSSQGQVVILGDLLLQEFLDEWCKESRRIEQRLRALFIAADVDGDGNLTLDEFKVILQFVLNPANVGKWEAAKMYQRCVENSDAIADADLPPDQITPEGFSSALITEGRVIAELVRVVPTISKNKAKLRNDVLQKLDAVVAGAQAVALEHEGEGKAEAIYAAEARVRQLLEYSDIEHARAACVSLDLLHFVAHGSRGRIARSQPSSAATSPSASRQASPSPLS